MLETTANVFYQLSYSIETQCTRTDMVCADEGTLLISKYTIHTHPHGHITAISMQTFPFGFCDPSFECRNN